MSKILFFDTETTGVRFWKDGIHQLSGIIEINGEVKEEFNFNIKPNPAAEISDEALNVSGVTKEQILSYPEMKEVYNEFVNMLSKYVDKFNKKDKFHLCGYNNRGFDDQFLRAWFVQNGDQYFGSWFWSDSLDVMVLASHFFIDKREMMQDFKLKTVCGHAGINIDESKLHDAIYDVKLTRELFLIVTK